MRLMPRLRRNSGFTLIELIMTIIVLAIIAIPLSLLLSQHISSVFAAEDYAAAVNLGRFEMEKVNNLAYTNIISANFPNYEGYNYDVTRTVSFAQGNAASAESLRSIRVDVRRSGSATVLLSLNTYIARNVNYGL